LDVQRLFWEAISHPTSVRAFLDGSDERTRAGFARVFAGSATFPIADRLEVYARASFYRLLDVLKEQFPVVLGYLGSDDFHDLVTEYLLEHPSRSANLHHLGDALPDFIAQHRVAEKRPYLGDFARIERALGHAIEAADDTPVAATDLARVSPTRWPVLCFRLVQSADLLNTRWDLRPAHAATREHKPLPEPVPGEPTLVWRRGYVPCFRPVGAAEEAALRLLALGCNFAALGQQFASLGESPRELSEALARWVNEELVRCPGLG
jgi:hypothetical protein